MDGDDDHDDRFGILAANSGEEDTLFGTGVYAFAVFGYLAATLSSFFIERDAAHDQAELVGTHTINELRKHMERTCKLTFEPSWSAPERQGLRPKESDEWGVARPNDGLGRLVPCGTWRIVGALVRSAR